MPFPWAPRWTKGVLLWMAAPSAHQPDTSGDPAALTVFTVPAGRFVTPICFENVDAAFVARMLREPGGGKRADFIVNLTNDGWFADLEHAHHFAAATFRAIENRVPIARASNTGISAFVDSCGRVLQRLPPRAQGTLTATLPLDLRMTLYTRLGDVFAIGCTLAAAGIILVSATRRRHAG
jgi:apolipoprotein N-acyltransferase